MACPLAEYSVLDDQGFPHNLYMRKLHIVPRFGGMQKIFRPWMFPFFSNGMWEFIFILFWRTLKEGIHDKKPIKGETWCLKSHGRLFIYIFKKQSSRWGALSSSEKCSSRKATALISKEEILNNADFFFISVWVFDNSVYL